MQTISNTAKAQMIAYLNQMAEAHKPAIKSLLESLKEETEGFIADLSDEVANIEVSVSETSWGSILISIQSGLNEASGFGRIYLSVSGLSKQVTAETPGGLAVLRCIYSLVGDAEFSGYTKSVFNQFYADWLPMHYYEKAANAMQRTLLEVA